MISSLLRKIRNEDRLDETARGFEFFSIFPTYRCNFNCSYCCCHTTTGQRARLPKGEELAAEQYLKLNEIKHLLPPLTFHVHGGEPLLYGDISPLLHGLDFPDIVVVSNFSLPVDDRVEHLEQLRGKVRFIGSYHPEFADLDLFLDNADRLRNLGMLLRVTGVGEHVSEEAQQHFKSRDYEMVIYPYKGVKDGVIHPEDMRSHARGWLTGECGKNKECRSLKFLVDPYGNVWNCSTHMYLGNETYCYGDILDGFSLAPRFYPCSYYHYCNPCQGDHVEYREPHVWKRLTPGRSYKHL